MDEFYKGLANYGALGIVTGVLLWFMIRTFTAALRDLSKGHEKLAELINNHASQISRSFEKLIDKIDNMGRK